MRELVLGELGAAENKEFESFKSGNSQIEIQVEQRPGHHPLLIGHYVQGRILPSGERLPKQVCVKNESAKEILGRAQAMRDEWGTTAKTWNTRHWRQVESIQGTWTPLTRIQ